MGKKFVGLDGLKHFWSKAKTWIAEQITAEVTAKIAEIVAEAPEDLDTLKEIADWISSHANDAAAMNTEILANTEAISGKADKRHTHTKSEITDFPTSLEGFIKSKTVKVGNIKIPTSCYFEISVDLKSSDTVISAKLSTWGSNTGVFSIICYGKNRVFIVGDIGTTIIDVSLLVFYI